MEREARKAQPVPTSQAMPAAVSVPAVDRVLALQRSAGNAAVTRALARSPLSDQVKTAPDKGAVFALLRKQGGPVTDADTISAVQALYPQGTDDRWLAEQLIKYGPEPLWPAPALSERTQRSSTGKWAPEPGNISAVIAPPDKDPDDANAKPVVAYFFPGQSERRALIIGGVHGSEPQGVEVVESLRGELEKRCAAGKPPFFTVILIPALNARTYGTGKRFVPRDPKENAEKTAEQGIEPNRTFPAPGEDYADARARVAAGKPELTYTPPAGAKLPSVTGHETNKMLPETRALIALIERFSPERIASVHAHGISGGAAKVGDDPGIFVDPATDDAAAGEQLGKRMLAEGKTHAGQLPTGRKDPFRGNVGDSVTYSPGAPHARGYSLGSWAPAPTKTRKGITTVTVEVPQYGGDKAATQQVEDLQRDILRDIFLGPDPKAPPTSPGPP
jgi:hypothetical protein